MYPYQFLAAAIKCWVGEGDIPVIDYQMTECDGIGQNACVKTSITGKTKRACGIGLADVCLGDTCTCTTALCNSGMSIRDSKKGQLAILLVNVALAAFVQRMI